VETLHALPASLLSSLSAFVATNLGLHFPEERWSDLERGIAAAAHEFGLPDAESFARWLLSATLTRSHIDLLASHLTVGETYFFREQESLEIFEQQIVPELLHSRADGERRLRIWSAGCCTGEEPYSIAMILDRVVAGSEGWNITILATDINPQFLRKAAEGVYGEWSLRSTPAWIRERYFTKTDGRFELDPRIRRRVTFSYLNLATDVYPSLLNNTNAMDVIFCRNVLLYFTEQRAAEAARNLYHSLVGDGWLLGGASETWTTLFHSFSAVQFPKAVLYRKQAGPELPRVVIAPPPLPLAEPDVFTNEALEPPRAFAITESPAADPHTADRPVPDHDVVLTPSADARRCANEGRLAEAIECCEKAIAIDKLNPAHRYLLGTIQMEQGDTEAATESLRRSLYIDSAFVPAHLALANIESSRGRPRGAERHYANALAALQAYAHDEIVPESEGLTAGRLAEIIASLSSSLPRAADSNNVRSMSA
jgi:chemotaxis protein methyltransferase CheR